MKKIALIPARYESTRFPYKLIQTLGLKTVIRHTYDNIVSTGLFDDVVVVTDNDKIYQEISGHGGKAMMSIKHHESGSDRIAEAAENMDADVILNVQGDEPFVDKESLRKLLEVFDGTVQVGSLMKKFSDLSIAADPNIVKVVVDKQSRSLFFSRSPIPFVRDETNTAVYYEHIGVYAFTKAALLKFTKWAPTPLEQMEKLEQLRYLENGIAIRMVETTFAGIKIDIPSDLQKAEDYLKNGH